MNKDKLLEIIQSSQAQLNQLKDAHYEGMQSQINELELLFHEFKESGEKLLSDSDVLQIGIVGQVKAGKSSFLNSLFFNGESILPKASTPMTAGLTVLEYAENNTFEVEYFEDKDWQIFVSQDSEYQSREKEVRENNPNAPDSVIRKELESRTSEQVRSAHEMVSACSTKAKSKIGKQPDVQKFSDISDLQDILEQYVGANGEYTSVVKSLCIKMNDERLKGLRIVDTPGVNDPVVSRENRTRTFLQSCHGVFLLSASGDFLGSGDVAFLNSRIGGSGIGTVVLLASKFDSVLQDLGFESEQKGEESDLVETIDKQKKKFKKRLRELSDTIDEKLRDRIKLDTTSGIGYSIAHKPSSKWDEGEKNVVNNMKRYYPNYFTSEQETKETFEGLANMDEIRDKYLDGTFMQNKDEIISEKVNAFFSTKQRDINSVISRILEELEMRKKQLNETTVAEIQQQKDQQARLFDGLKGKFSNIFGKFCDVIQSEINRIKNTITFNEIRSIPTETTSGSVTYKGRLWGHNTDYISYDQVNTSQLCREIEEAIENYGKSWNDAWKKMFEEARRSLAEETNTTISDFEKQVMSTSFNDVYYRNLIEKVLDNMRLNKELEIRDFLDKNKRAGVDVANNQFYPTGTDDLKKDQLGSYLRRLLNEHNSSLIRKFMPIAEGVKVDMGTEVKKKASSACGKIEKMKSDFSDKLKQESADYLESLEKDLMAKTEVLRQLDKVIAIVSDMSNLYK